MWTGQSNAPIQWQNFRLMREVFHCTPSELKAQKIGDIQAALVCMEVEAKVNNAKRQVNSGVRLQ